MADKNLGAFRLNPTGKFNPEKQYSFLDMVEYEGSSYVCINDDIIDGVSNIGILPVGQEKSPLYYHLVASKGEKGDIANKYDGFIKLESNTWDYSISDKVLIPADTTIDNNNPLIIDNVYDGCCGLIVSNINLALPENSDYSIDFNYLDITSDTEYYLYSFICRQIHETKFRFIWNRTLINANDNDVIDSFNLDPQDLAKKYPYIDNDINVINGDTK